MYNKEPAPQQTIDPISRYATMPKPGAVTQAQAPAQYRPDTEDDSYNSIYGIDDKEDDLPF